MVTTSEFKHLGQELALKHMRCAELQPYKNNPRTHSDKQIEQIASSIKEFGWTNPILVDPDGGVIAGHGRLEAAKLLGLTVVPVIELGHLSEAQKKAYVIADNKLAENAGWDMELLQIEVQNIMELELDYDLTLCGFEMGEIDFMLCNGDAEEVEREK